VLSRDGSKCSWIYGDGNRCGLPATDIDHIIPGDDHSLSNLRGLCADHHRKKSSREGLAAKREIAGRFKREPEIHPGYSYMKQLQQQQ
jgi:5-methylcytosine-specific restriction endonuclease McrA